MSLDDSTPEKQMLQMLNSFYDYHNHRLDSEVCKVLNNYVSTKPNRIAGVLALLFQLPYSPLLTKNQVEQAIARLIDCRFDQVDSPILVCKCVSRLYWNGIVRTRYRE